MKSRAWVHAKALSWGFRCSCDICRCNWSLAKTLRRPKVADAVNSMCRHVMDYHGGVDQHD